MQRARRAAAAAALACALAACSGGGPPAPAATVPEEPQTLEGRVLRDAQDVAGQLEQRQADLESMLP